MIPALLALFSAAAVADDPVPEPAPAPAPVPAPEAPPPLAAPTEPTAPTAPPTNPWHTADPAARAPLDEHVSVAVELGTLHDADPTFDLFTPRDAISSFGARVGVRLVDRVEVFADWQRDRVGRAIGSEYPTEDMVFAFGTNQLRLGGKVDTNVISDWFRPYGALDALLVQGTARFDDDASDPDSPGQTARRGLGPGGELLVGMQGLVAPYDVNLGLEAHLEGGYALVAPLALGDVGSMSVGGFTLRAGVGVVF